MRPRTAHPAFTLFELVLAMILIVVALGIIAPNLRGWSRSTQLKDAAREFVSLTQLARAQAVSTARVHRVVTDPATRRFWLTVQDAQTFSDYPSDLGRPDPLPEHYSFRFVDAAGQPTKTFLDFYPTGRCDVATLRFESVDGSSDPIDVACETPTEGFRLLPGVPR